MDVGEKPPVQRDCAQCVHLRPSPDLPDDNSRTGRFGQRVGRIEDRASQNGRSEGRRPARGRTAARVEAAPTRQPSACAPRAKPPARSGRRRRFHDHPRAAEPAALPPTPSGAPCGRLDPNKRRFPSSLVMGSRRRQLWGELAYFRRSLLKPQGRLPQMTIRHLDRGINRQKRTSGQMTSFAEVASSHSSPRPRWTRRKARRPWLAATVRAHRPAARHAVPPCT